MLVVGLALAAFAAAATLAALGAFATVVVEKRVVGPHRFVYRTLEGVGFRQVGELTEQVGDALRAAGARGIQPLDWFQPAGSEAPNEIGYAVAAEEAALLPALDPDLHQRTIPAEHAMTVRFPFVHPLSCVVGYGKVARALAAHRAAHAYADGPSYTLHAGDTILYVQPVVR
jgi:hypothetical protein